MKTATVFKIALVCPSDVVGDRSVAASAIDGLQRAAERRGLRLAVRTWEDVPPNFYPEKVQTRIDEDLDIPNCDVVVGIFWKRYGAVDEPPYSRTAREILRAMEAKRVRGSPQVMVYFANREYMPRSPQESSEQTAVLRFKEELQEKEVRTKDFTSCDFGLTVALDVLEYLDQFVFGTEPSPELICRLSLSPTFARSEGYTELIGEPTIVLSGIIPEASPLRVVHADLNIWLNTTITTRIQGSKTNAVVVSNVRGQLGVGHLTRSNGILFNFPLGAPGSKIDEVLSIRGIRADAEFLGIAGGFDATITGALELAIVNADQSRLTLLKESFVAATLRQATTFSVSPVGRDILRFTHGDRVHLGRESSFVVTFYIPFDGVFKTKEQESANLPRSADHGTAIAIALADVPPNTTVFVTSKSIRHGEFYRTNAPMDNALLVQTDAAGNPTDVSNWSFSEPSWDGQASVVEVGQGLAVWEIVTPIAAEMPQVLSFGISFLRHDEASGPGKVQIAAGLAPFFGATTSGTTARQPSQTLPVPRFVPGHFIQVVELIGD